MGGGEGEGGGAACLYTVCYLFCLSSIHVHGYAGRLSHCIVNALGSCDSTQYVLIDRANCRRKVILPLLL